MKNIMKKFLSIFVVLTLAVCVFACGKDKAKENANVTDANSTYISVTEGTTKYEVSKGKLYNELKSTVGYNTLINLIMTDILTENGKLAEVSDEDIIAEIDKAVYGSDEDLTDEEKAEAKEEFLNDMFRNYGYSGNDIYADEVKAVYRLNLAKKAYAKSKLEEEIAEHDEKYNEWVSAGSDEEDEDAVKEPYFTEAALKSQYATSNPSEFWAIVIPFTTLNEYNTALNATGKKEAFEAGTLSKAEVLDLFVNLYKAVYDYKLTSEDNLDTTTLTEESKFYFTQSALKSYSAQIADYVANTLKTYNSDETKYYTNEVLTVNAGAYYTLVLKLDEKVATVYDELTAEAKEEADAAAKEVIINKQLTTTYVTKKMYEAMAKKNLTIYDSTLAAAHTTTAATNSVVFEATEESSKTLVAKIDGKEYTADALFAAMDEVAGMTTALSEINYERFLNNAELNKYYNVKEGKWTDKDVQDEIEDEVKTEKKNFENGDYVNYGYDPETIGWTEFVRSVYGVNNEEELILLFLYNKLVSDFTKGLNDIEAEESKVWPFIQTKMQETLDDYFNVKGIHLLICVFDDPTGEVNNGTPVDPAKWTESQKALAAELFAEVKEYVAAAKGTYAHRLEQIQKAFDECSRLDTTKTLENIEVGKYRAAGLYAKFENLGTFKNGSMVEAFNDAVKSIYDADIKADKTERTTVCEQMIETEFGFHFYVNLASTKAPTYSVKVNEETTKFELPRLEEILAYLEDEDDVKSDAKTIITTYYSPISKELEGSYLTYVLQYEAIKAIIDTVTVSSDKYTKDDLVRIMELETNDWFENLTYVTEEDLVKLK